MTHQQLAAVDLRAVVEARCCGRCESCGSPLSATWWECHHRQLRKHGGPDCPCNAVGLHPRCHNMAPGAVHSEPAAAYDRGLLVHSWDDPRQAPLDLPRALRAGQGAVLLGCGGTYL